MRVYLVRHGETILNKKRCYYGKTDAVLSKEGIRQAEYLQKIFDGMQIDYAFSSPLVRAYNTAEIILGERRMPLNLFPDSCLEEQNFGIFEGLTYRELEEKYPTELRAWNENYAAYCIPDGESFLDVRKRAEEFLARMRKLSNAMQRTAADGGEKNVLIVAHKGTLGHLLAAMLSLPPEGYWNFVFEQGCYSRVDLEDGYAIIRKLNAKIL